jgi:outer membrane protein OmpA-like peptidoglycan-associated protein
MPTTNRASRAAHRAAPGAAATPAATPAAAPAFTIILALLCLAVSAPAQESETLVASAVSPEERYTTLTRYNLSRHQDGRYQGHVYREIRGTLRRAGVAGGAADDGRGTHAVAGGIPYTGEFYVFEQTRRDARNVARRVNRSVPVSLEILSDGSIRVPDDQPFPLRRGFPRIPTDSVEIGETWEAPGELVVDPNWTGEYTRIGILAAYRYDGREQYQGREVHRITAQYATRYRQGDDPAGDPELAQVSGSHTSTILIDADTRTPVLIRDQIEEQYRYSDGRSIGFRGFALTFYSTPIALDRPGLVARIERRLEESEVEDIEVTEDDEGVRLSLRDIRFVANEATILPEERGRLDALAETLAAVPDRSFLVVGHTADIGLPDAQQELSVRRARTVVEELTRRGIEADRLIFEGRGGTEPVASNDTEAGRAQNRRVEITVLE